MKNIKLKKLLSFFLLLFPAVTQCYSQDTIEDVTFQDGSHYYITGEAIISPSTPSKPVNFSQNAVVEYKSGSYILLKQGFNAYDFNPNSYFSAYYFLNFCDQFSIDAGSDVSVCKGERVQLDASEAVQYQWFPSAGLSCTYCENPVVYPDYPVKYYVMAYDSLGCQSIDSVFIDVDTTNFLTVSQDVSICKGGNTQLSASGGVSYSWSPPEGLSCIDCAQPIANPSHATQYTVTSFNSNGCSNSKNVTVTVLPVSGIGSDALICEGDSVQLFAFGGTSYLWYPSSGLSCTTCSSPYAKPTVTTEYNVLITDNMSCTAIETVEVTVQEPADVTAMNDTIVLPGENIKLTAQGGSDYYWYPSENLNCNNCDEPYATILETVTYFVKANNGFCSDSDSVVIFVDSLYTFEFQMVQNGYEILFNIDYNGADSYSWNFGDYSQTSNDTDPAHTFPNKGAYYICVDVIKDGVTVKKCSVINVLPFEGDCEYESINPY